ncbi:MAG: histidine kinase [Gemmatimonadota bacterium]
MTTDAPAAAVYETDQRPAHAIDVRAAAATLAILWLGLGVLDVATRGILTSAAGNTRPLLFYVGEGVEWLPWAALSVPAAAFARWARPDKHGWGRTLALQLGAGLAFAFLQGLAATAALEAIGIGRLAFGPQYVAHLNAHFVRWFGTYLAGVGAVYFLAFHKDWRREAHAAQEAEQRAAELEAEAARGRFDALRRRLDPDRVQASLLAIRADALAGRGVAAEGRIAALGEELRRSLGSVPDGAGQHGAQERHPVDGRLSRALTAGPPSAPAAAATGPGRSERAGARAALLAGLPVLLFWSIYIPVDLAKDAVFLRSTGAPVTLAAFRDPLGWWFCWLLLTPAIILVGRGLRPERLGWRRAVPAHLAIGVLFVLAQASLAVTWFRAAPGVQVGFSQLLLTHLTAFGLASYGVYLGAAGAYYAGRYYRDWRERRGAARAARLRVARLESLLAQARTEALRRDLHPHFLYNALQSAAGLVREGAPERAADMIGALDELLAASLRRDDEPKVTLADELALLDRYLAIETVRFEDRLRVRRDVEQGLEGSLVPTLLLQPLVENAVRHGVAMQVDPVTVRITARAVGGRLQLTVEDDGPGPPDDPASSNGIGLANTRARLRHLYGTEARVELARGETSGAVARVELPLDRREGDLDAVAS